MDVPSRRGLAKRESRPSTARPSSRLSAPKYGEERFPHEDDDRLVSRSSGRSRGVGVSARRRGRSGFGCGGSGGRGRRGRWSPSECGARRARGRRPRRRRGRRSVGEATRSFRVVARSRAGTRRPRSCGADLPEGLPESECVAGSRGGGRVICTGTSDAVQRAPVLVEQGICAGSISSREISLSHQGMPRAGRHRKHRVSSRGRTRAYTDSRGRAIQLLAVALSAASRVRPLAQERLGRDPPSAAGRPRRRDFEGASAAEDARLAMAARRLRLRARGGSEKNSRGCREPATNTFPAS